MPRPPDAIPVSRLHYSGINALGGASSWALCLRPATVIEIPDGAQGTSHRLKHKVESVRAAMEEGGPKDGKWTRTDWGTLRQQLQGLAQ